MPIKTEEGFITANGLQIHYCRWSAPGANPALPPILLLHGLASSAHIWNLVAPQLISSGYSVTALDQRGHGESEKPNSGYDFATILVDDVAAIKVLGIEHPILVGQWSPELEESILQIVQLRDDDTVAPRLDYENHLQIIGAMWDQPTFDLYRKVHCPITLIVADQEPMNEAMKEFVNMRKQGIAHIQEVRSDVHIVIMQNTMHDIPLQRPEELAEIIVKAGAVL